MSYNYEEERPKLFTEEMQAPMMHLRDHAFRLLEEAGAVSMGKLLDHAGTGDSWTMMAMVDRLVEMGDIKECERGGYYPGQHRIFVKVGE